MIKFCYLLALLLVGCTGSRPDAQQNTTEEDRYPGGGSLALLYTKSAAGEMLYLCSGAFVTLDHKRIRQPGILTASHCFADAQPGNQGYFVSFDDGKDYLKLGRSWMGDRFAGADIAFIDFDPQETQHIRTLKPLPVGLEPPAAIAGDDVWVWSNPDNQGRALSVGYVMNQNYQKPPISGTIDGKEVLLDIRGYIVTDINTAPGSSGGLVLSNKGAIGVLSSDFRHEGGFKTAFVTPISRLKLVLLAKSKAVEVE